MSLSVQILMGSLVVLGYLVAPIVLVWGWLRWTDRPKSWTWPAILSLIGFVLASASALLAVLSVAYAQIHRFPYYDPLLMKIFAIGWLLSIAGFIFGVAGLWKESALRWHAPICAIATFAFWFSAAIAE